MKFNDDGDQPRNDEAEQILRIRLHNNQLLKAITDLAYLPMLGKEDWKRSSFPPTCCITFFAALRAGPVHVFTVQTTRRKRN